MLETSQALISQCKGGFGGRGRGRGNKKSVWFQSLGNEQIRGPYYSLIGYGFDFMEQIHGKGVGLIVRIRLG